MAVDGRGPSVPSPPVAREPVSWRDPVMEAAETTPGWWLSAPHDLDDDRHAAPSADQHDPDPGGDRRDFQPVEERDPGLR